MIVGALGYIFLGSADVQHYNDPNWKEKKKEKKTEVARPEASDTKHIP